MHAIIRSTLYLFTFLFGLYCRVVFNAEYFMIFFSSNAIQVATTNITQCLSILLFCCVYLYHEVSAYQHHITLLPLSKDNLSIKKWKRGENEKSRKIFLGLYCREVCINPFSESQNPWFVFGSGFKSRLGYNGVCTLVTQPMLQRRPNRTELRSMYSYIQILCRFQKNKLKVPQPSPLITQKSSPPPKDEKNLPLWG